jgi:hypothetical protein
MRTNQQVIDLWRSLLPSIKKDGDKITIKSRGNAYILPITKSATKSSFSKNNQYR